LKIKSKEVLSNSSGLAQYVHFHGSMSTSTNVIPRDPNAGRDESQTTSVSLVK